MELLSKVTVKTVGAQPKPKSIEHQTDLCAIYGILRGYTIGQSAYGEFIKFKGDIEARNLETDETYKSGALILPGIVSGILQGAVDGNPESDVEFGVIVGVKPSEKGNTGYEYTIKPLTEVKEADALVALRSVVNSKLLALPAPDAKEEKAPAKGGSKK